MDEKPGHFLASEELSAYLKIQKWTLYKLLRKAKSCARRLAPCSSKSIRMVACSFRTALTDCAPVLDPTCKSSGYAKATGVPANGFAETGRWPPCQFVGGPAAPAAL